VAIPFWLALLSVVGLAILALGLCALVALAGVRVGKYLDDPRRPKPPLGFSPFEPEPPLWRRCVHRLRRAWWRVRATACVALVKCGVKKSW
jgi:hypothetical protein